MIFAREISDNLTSLVKKIDMATAEHEKQRMGSFVVFMSDEEGLKDKIKGLSEKEGLKNIVLTIDNVAGPKNYKVAKDAEVTVVLYDKRKVESNFAFRKGELTSEAVAKVVADLKKIVPEAENK
jgi:hypothetical protein